MELTEPTTWGDLPAIRLNHPSGAFAVITLYGAHLVQWCSSDGRSHLFCSEKSSRDGKRAIRGGVPVIFPQFGARGTGMRHGFARISNWRHASSGSHDDGTCWSELVLTRADVAASAALSWSQPFECRLRVDLQAQALEVHLQVNNPGSAPFSFSSALHNYWQLDDLSSSPIGGLQGCPFSDQTSNTTSSAIQDSADLIIASKLDRIYGGASHPVTLRQPHSQLKITQHGFSDVVVWNPGAEDAAGLPDLANEEYHHFVCIEPAQVAPHALAGGASWHGWQRIEVLA